MTSIAPDEDHSGGVRVPLGPSIPRFAKSNCSDVLYGCLEDA